MANEIVVAYRNSTVRNWNASDVEQMQGDLLEEGVVDESGDGTDCKVTQNGTPDNTVLVKVGKVYINDVDTGLEQAHTERFHVRTQRQLTVPANATGNIRVDAVIARIDVDTEPNANADNIGTCEIITGSGVSALSDGAIQTAVGDDAWYRLADINTPNGFSSIVTADIVDRRKRSRISKRAFVYAQDGSMHFAVATGSSNAFLVALSPTLDDGYTAGLRIIFRANHTITGAATVNVDSYGVKDLRDAKGNPLSADEITSNMMVEAVYDATSGYFRVISSIPDTTNMVPAGAMMMWVTNTAPSGWLLCYGQAVSRATYPTLFDSIVASIGTFTVTIASPAVFSKTAHGLGVGDAVYFTTTGALPTGLSQNTLYYVISAGLTADAFQVSTSRGGSAVNTSGTQSGVHTARNCPYGLGDGSTTFNLPDMRGRFPLGQDDLGGSSANRVTHINADALGAAEGAETKDINHTHSIPNNQPANTTGGPDCYGINPQNTSTGSMSANSNPNVMNPYITMNFIIRT